MWGEMSNGKTGNTAWFKSVGYVGLVKRTYSNGSTATMYLCEAGSGPAHDRGEFDMRDNESDVLNRGHCALFDSPCGVRVAASRRGVELVKVLKVTYTESAAFEEAE